MYVMSKTRPGVIQQINHGIGLNTLRIVLRRMVVGGLNLNLGSGLQGCTHTFEGVSTWGPCKSEWVHGRCEGVPTRISGPKLRNLVYICLKLFEI